MIKRKTGFTLIELLIVMAILSFVLALTTDMFINMLRQYNQQGKIAETNIEGVIGLEMLRQDIERAGTGLPWVIPSGIAYTEATQAGASGYNDCSGTVPCNPPRPILSDNNYSSGPPPSFGLSISTTNGYNYSDLLVIKATNIIRNAASQNWAYLTTSVTRTWDQAPDNLSSTDYVSVLSPGATESQIRTLVTVMQYNNGNIAGVKPASQDPQPLFVYGLYDNSLAFPPPRMPFNRADYYISTTNVPVPQRCAPNTGVLVKSMIGLGQGDGQRRDYLPLLDCVADMKVIFQLDTNGDGTIDTPTDSLTGLTAQQIRTQVKEVRVYILAQEGQKDPTYISPTPIWVGDPSVSLLLSHHVNVGANVNYRWKLYTIVVQPKNMRQS